MEFYCMLYNKFEYWYNLYMYFCLDVKMRGNSDCYVILGLIIFWIIILFIILDGFMCWVILFLDIIIFKVGCLECFLK